MRSGWLRRSSITSSPNDAESIVVTVGIAGGPGSVAWSGGIVRDSGNEMSPCAFVPCGGVATLAGGGVAVLGGGCASIVATYSSIVTARFASSTARMSAPAAPAASAARRTHASASRFSPRAQSVVAV
jgi:hypothetical protein